MNQLFRFFSLTIVFSICFGAKGQTLKTANVVDHWQMVVNASSNWKYMLGTSEPDSNWRKISFVDTAWSTGKAGFGYGDNDDTTLFSSAINSCYIRQKFTLADTSKIWDAILNIDYDDGFVAYINDVEVARANIGVQGDHPAYDSLAFASHEAQMYQSAQPSYIIINKALLKQCLIQGTNVLCIQVHNTANSNDLSLWAWLMVGINDKTYATPTPPNWFTPPLTSHLPLIVINTNGQGIPNEPKLTCDMGVIENGFNQNHSSDPFNHYNGKIGIETRGSSSSGFPQQSYGFSTYDSNGNNMNAKLLGYPSEHDYILYAPYTDKSLMRNNLMYEISNQMGWYASRCKFVEVILNGSYQGIYVLMETIKTDKNRVDIPSMDTSMNSGDRLTGGYLMKVDRVKQSGLGYWHSAVTNFNGNGKDYYIQTVKPDIPDLTQQQLNYIKPWMDNFESVLKGNLYTSTSTGYRKYIDVNSFIDYYIANELSRNVDGYRLSCFFYKQRESLGGRLYMGPQWDYNIALGNANYCNGSDTFGWNDCSYQNIPFWFERLLQDADYKKQLVCRWQNYRKNILLNTNIQRYIDSVAEYLEIPQRRHYQKWQILGTYVWPNAYIGNTYKDEVNYLKRYVRGRLNWIDKNLPKVAPVCNSVFLNTIGISEVMYNCDTSMNGGNWIELYNKGLSSVSVGNYVIRDESGFRSYTIPGNTSIPAKGFLVIVEDTAAFRKIYPQVKNYIGPTNWGLSNDGGTISLRDASNFLITAFKYNDKAPWPTLADGKGNSLELKTLGINPNFAASWRDGCIGGTPGWAGDCSQKLLVTEINYASPKNADAGDWIELWNSDTVDMNLSKWTIKDNDDSNAYIFPNNSILKAGQYLVLCEDTVKFKAVYPKVKNYQGELGYGLSSKADAIRIYNPLDIAYQRVYYTDTFPFPYGAKGTGLTIELIDSTTNILTPQNWTLSCPGGTPGRKRLINCFVPQIPVLKFTELNLAPDQFNNDGQWIEIYNEDTLDLPIDQWQLRSTSGQLIQFAANTRIKAKSYILLTTDSNSFIRWHGNQFPLLGNLNSAIQLSGDSLLLIDTFGQTVMSIYIQANKHNQALYTGRTLERVDTASNPNLSSSWFAGCIHGSPNRVYSPCKELNYISEFNYNTPGGDWIELYNPTSDTISFNQWKIRGYKDTSSTEISGTQLLPSASRMLLVNDSQAFAQVHPFITNYLKLHTILDTLDGIKIYNDSDVLIYSLQYNQNHIWTDSAFHLGYTLELTDETKLPNDTSAWHSFCPNGSPRRTPEAPCSPALSSALEISEINYLSDSLQNSGSWLEVMNKSADTLYLEGWAVQSRSKKILYQFESGAYMLPYSRNILVEDSNLFRKVHPQSNIYTQLSNALNNNQDTFAIKDYSGTIAVEAAYSDQNLRLTPAAGIGRTLELASNGLPGTAPMAWTIGCIHGSPGKVYETCLYDLLFTEVHYNGPSLYNAGQWFELHNNTPNDRDISGYTIHHVASNQSYKIPPGTTLYHDSFLVFIQDTARFSAVHGLNLPYITYNFNLQRNGDALLLYNTKLELQQSQIWQADTPWNTMPDGKGFTLELQTDTGVLCYPEYWTISCRYGTPGQNRFAICDNVGINSVYISSPKIMVYPNPAADEIYFENIVQNESIEIMDIRGCLMRSGALPYHQQKIDTRLWPAGMYFWRCGEQSGKISIIR